MPPLIARIRFQLLGGLFVCVFLPGMLRGQLGFLEGSQDNLNNTTLGAILAIIVGYYLMRRMGDFPGVHSGSHTLLAFTAPFCVAVAAFLLFRLDYSRLFFLMTYVLTLVWFVTVHLASKRLVVPQLALVPSVNAMPLLALPRVRWSLLARPPTGGLENITGVVADLRSDELGDEWTRFLADCALKGTPVFHTKQIHESITGKVQLEHLSENTFGTLLPNLGYIKAKQLLDWLAALALLPLFIIVLAVVGPLIMFSSGWPIFFVQERVGYRGKRFNIYKFRTMKSAPTNVSGADNARGAAMTLEGDARITPIGRFLRRYRIDEFPQILNILKGEMSWIGPRPEAVPLSEWYETSSEPHLPFYRYRHVVRPGISGWAQVNQGHVVAPDDVLDKLHYDFFYIKHISLWLDLVIIIKTVKTILVGFGSK